MSDAPSAPEPRGQELLPCPFCGSEAKLFEHPVSRVGHFAVQCSSDCTRQHGWFQNTDQARTAWNTRAQPATDTPVASVPRFDFEWKSRGMETHLVMVSDDTGEWCRYEYVSNTIARLQREAEGLRREREQLRAFAADVLDEFWEGGMDGCDLQDIGAKHGLLIQTEMDKPCSEEEGGCSCVEAGAYFPTRCYRYAPILSHPASETQR